MPNLISVMPGQCELVADFLEPSIGYEYMARIQQQAQWNQQTINIFDKAVNLPRLTAWYGDDKAIYQYSEITNTPQPWFDALSELKQQVENHTQSTFNSVLLNYYRNGDDSMGKHSDNEKELGPEPVIASLSLGATRRFILHPQSNNARTSIKLNLPHGALLVMFGRCQKMWQHSIPKTKQLVGPRINLTYRLIKT